MTALQEEAIFEDACHLKAEVASSGVMGGDAGHGGWTEVTLSDAFGNCALAVDVQGARGGQVGQVTIRVEGDAEMVVLAEALEWAGRRLRENAGERAVPNAPEPEF